MDWTLQRFGVFGTIDSIKLLKFDGKSYICTVINNKIVNKHAD